jgi:hypothetical protein
MDKGDRHAAFSYPYGASPNYPSVLIGSLLAAAENAIRRPPLPFFPKDMYPAP